MTDKNEPYKKILEERDLMHGAIHEFTDRVKGLMEEVEELKKNQCSCYTPKESDAESETP